MRVNVKFFAIVKDRAGVPELSMELPPGSTVAAAMNMIALRFPQIASMLERTAIAVNRSYVQRDAILHDGDELALIPPVSGGCDR